MQIKRERRRAPEILPPLKRYSLGEQGEEKLRRKTKALTAKLRERRLSRPPERETTKRAGLSSGSSSVR